MGHAQGARSTALRILLVGCGDIAATGHLPALRRSKDVELVGVVDTDRARRDKASRDHAVPGWSTLSEAQVATAQAVVIAVPPHIAPALTTQALHAGLDVLCEKPMATDLGAANAVAATAEASDRIVQIGFKNRFSPLVRAARDWIADGRLGSPVVYTLGGFDESHDARDELHFSRIQNFLAHGPSFVHEGAHLADHLAFLTGSTPVSVQAAGVRSSPEFRSENFVSALVRYNNGDLARLEVGWLFPSSPPGEFRALGPRGVILLDRPGQVATLTTRDDNGAIQNEEVRFGRPWNDECFDRQLAHFVECVRSRRTPETDISAGLASMRLGHAVAEAMNAEQVIQW